MSSTFTPSAVVDISKERDWPADLGMLDWDNTSIVFTKRTLVEFLKYTGTTVDTNFNNIAKLPGYAKFGKLSATDSEDQANVELDSTTTTDEFVPSRRVRTAPGGPHTDIFAHDDEGDALSKAPPKVGVAEVTLPANDAAVGVSPPEEEEEGINFSSLPMPSRRVRENAGGHSNLSNFWDAEEPTQFKPTRRVRQGPGGHDSISGIF
ncbi:hypothetical protein M413DRAFT_438128 [Hebeloma cylindrosporum]|uniref:Uncharacterized protein n=1 Tax=Hebeloma cylindrosporum TaxID=76867 RepID=A0A0C3CYM9_HEBCY|nr:hypothetical protein M413DRAFT_438128 [Hebeloma cylindrosporum h7]